MKLSQILEVFRLYPNLWISLRHIVEHPHRDLTVLRSDLPIASAKNISPRNLSASLTLPGACMETKLMPHFEIDEIGWRFLRIREERTAIVYDTEPNRLVAHFLRFSLQILRRAIAECSSEEEIESADEIKRRLSAFRQAFFKELSPPGSDALLHQTTINDPNYRVISSIYRKLRKL